MTPVELRAHHGGLPLTGAIQNLKPMDQLEVARTAFTHGIIATANVLEVDVSELTACMVEWGYRQCPGCDEWVPMEELAARGGVVDSNDTAEDEDQVCESCRG